MSDARWGALIFSSAFLARLLAGLGSAIFGTDGCHYLLMADWMRAGRFHDALSLAYHPMYPLLIAAARTFTAGTEQAGPLVSIVLGAAAAVPLFLVAKSVFGRPTAVFAGLLYAFYPRVVELHGDVMTEGTFMFFLFSSLWLTHRIMEEPTLERGAVLGAAAAGAFLTRPEGLLAIAFAVGWPVLEALRTRDRWGLRAGGLLLTVAVLLLALSPYLLWVKSVRGGWALTVRPSAIAATGSETRVEKEAQSTSSRYRAYLVAVLRLSMYGLLIPFYVAGVAALRRVEARKALFYLSFPLAYLAAILFAIRTHDFMTERYLMPGMVLLGALAAHGMVAAIRTAARRCPDRPWVPTACGAAVLLIVAAPVFRCFQIRRTELLSFPGAARWIVARHGAPVAVTGLEQVSYYCGSRSYYLPAARGEFEDFLRRQPMDYIAYSDKELRTDPEFVAMLRSCDRLEAPLQYEGPPGTWKVYFQRVK